jgi:transcriptional regulator GlxA family with amidase domain
MARRRSPSPHTHGSKIARDTLMLTEDSIEEIALRAGYESRTAFDRAFQRRFSVTPGSVRFGA